MVQYLLINKCEISQNERQKSHGYINRFGKSIWYNPAPIYNTSTHQSGHKGSILQHNKGHIWKTYCQHHTQWAKTKIVSLNVRNQTRVSSFTTIIRHSTGGPSHRDQMKGNKRHPNYKGGSKLSLFVDYMALYIENSIGSVKKLLE